MTSKQLRKLLPNYIVNIFLMSILYLYGSSVSGANGLQEGKVVSLSQNLNNSDIILAYSKALYRVDTKAHKWVSISLPDLEEQLTAVVGPAEGTETLYLSSSKSGILKSIDGGKSWEYRNDGLPSKNVIGLIRHAKLPNTLYAINSDTGIFRSENAGESWQLMDRGPDDMTNTFIHSDMPDSMQTGWIFAATKAGVSRSMDCFCLWSEAGLIADEVTGLTYDPQQPAHIYTTTNKGLFRSLDGGESWESVEFPKIDVTALYFAPSGSLYAGTRTGELFAGIVQSKSWKQLDIY